jgi:DNA-binding LytR/AlgR family response regulator
MEKSINKMLITIAVVEDNDTDAENLLTCLNQFESENDLHFQISRHHNALTLLNAKQIPDIVFMDIELPDINGIEAALKLRQIDDEFLLFFVTNLAKYAIAGYEADAIDFLLKPIRYERLAVKLKKAMNIMSKKVETDIYIKRSGGISRISTRELLYIEVMNHILYYHTVQNTYPGYGSLTELEEQLRKKNFMRCNACYLVNPAYISAVKGQNVVMMNGDELKISQPKRKKFIDELTDYLGQKEVRQ